MGRWGQCPPPRIFGLEPPVTVYENWDPECRLRDYEMQVNYIWENSPTRETDKLTIYSRFVGHRGNCHKSSTKQIIAVQLLSIGGCAWSSATLCAPDRVVCLTCWSRCQATGRSSSSSSSSGQRTRATCDMLALSHFDSGWHQTCHQAATLLSDAGEHRYTYRNIDLLAVNVLNVIAWTTPHVVA